jgi:hypothetical protein
MWRRVVWWNVVDVSEEHPACCFSLAGYLFGLLVDPEDGDSIFLRNVSEILPYYTSQKTAFFIVTAVKTSDLTKNSPLKFYTPHNF